MLEGSTSSHDDGMSTLRMNECGFPLEFIPTDYESEGGNLQIWDNVKGGTYPWDERYYQDYPDTSTGFDPEYIMRHATDSASTAAALATGHKSARGMIGMDLYEEEVSTLVEDAMKCGKAGGVVTSVQMFHASPAAFILHTNNRSNREQLRRSFTKVNPTMVNGVCGGRYYPDEDALNSMRSGALSSQWTFLEQSTDILAQVCCSNPKMAVCV